MQNSGLAREAWLVNNPVLGSYLLWVFCSEYFKDNKKDIHPSLVFCVLPILFNSDTRDVLSSVSQSRNDLMGFIQRFETAKKCSADIPLVIHQRVSLEKEKTFESLLVAFDYGLIFIDSESGMLTPNLVIEPEVVKQLPSDNKLLVECSKKLGVWFSQMSVEAATKILRVYF